MGGVKNINTDETTPQYLFNFGVNWNIPTLLTGHNILPINASFATTPFSQLLMKDESELTGLMLSVGIINRMKTPNGDFIPFLEYQFSLCDDAWCTNHITIPDPYFTLQ